MKEIVEQILSETEQFGAVEFLGYVLEKFAGKIAFASSMGAEDQVVLDMLYKLDKNAAIFTLDTGRLPKETVELIEKTEARYVKNIEIIRPDSKEVAKMVSVHGENLFYESIENRKLCCGVRKIEPLKKRLGGLDAWICGLRAEQSVTRHELKRVQWDEMFGLIKLNPLADWTTEQVWAYIRENNVPYNKLHDQGYPSIGCEPCTKAVKAGEDIRAGRWWWESADTKECGLHALRAEARNPKS
jgi:phosphoadenosine phosphosulfate reductase